MGISMMEEGGGGGGEREQVIYWEIYWGEGDRSRRV